MPALLIVWLMAAQGYVPAAPPPRTVATFLSLCETNAKACSDAVLDIAEQGTAGERKVGYCLPETGAYQEIGAKAAAWLKTRPELMSVPAAEAIDKALIATQPCG